MIYSKKKYLIARLGGRLRLTLNHRRHGCRLKPAELVERIIEPYLKQLVVSSKQCQQFQCLQIQRSNMLIGHIYDRQVHDLPSIGFSIVCQDEEEYVVKKNLPTSLKVATNIHHRSILLLLHLPIISNWILLSNYWY